MLLAASTVEATPPHPAGRPTLYYITIVLIPRHPSSAPVAFISAPPVDRFCGTERNANYRNRWSESRRLRHSTFYIAFLNVVRIYWNDLLDKGISSGDGPRTSRVTSRTYQLFIIHVYALMDPVDVIQSWVDRVQSTETIEREIADQNRSSANGRSPCNSTETILLFFYRPPVLHSRGPLEIMNDIIIIIIISLTLIPATVFFPRSPETGGGR